MANPNSVLTSFEHNHPYPDGTPVGPDQADRDAAANLLAHNHGNPINFSVIEFHNPANPQVYEFNSQGNTAQYPYIYIP